MIYYVTLGSNDLHKGGVFYDAVLAPIGAGRIFDGDRMIVWGPDPERSCTSADHLGQQPPFAKRQFWVFA